MPPSGAPDPPEPVRGMASGGAEFVAIVAAIMAVNALGIDLMLPALTTIARDLGGGARSAPSIVTTYVLGFGVGQLAYGPLSDRFGRRPVLSAGLCGFVLAGVGSALATSLGALLAARFVQGLFSASTRVLSVAIVRDRFEGAAMARVSSLAQIVFFLVPVLAPLLGATLLAVIPWRGVLLALAAFAGSVAAWARMRLPETLPEGARRPLSVAALRESYRIVLADRQSVGYALAGAALFGGIVAFVSGAPEIFGVAYHHGRDLPALFGLCTLAMGCAAFANSRMVVRFGSRRIADAALAALIALSAVNVLLHAAGVDGLPLFLAFQAASMACIGLCGANFGALAMERVGGVAGTASSLQGFAGSTGAALIGAAIASALHGSSGPLAAGNLGVAVAASLATRYARSRTARA